MRNLQILLLLVAIATPTTVYSIDRCNALFDLKNAARTEARSGQMKAKPTDLYFKERIGKVEEHTVRAGQTAAHIYMDASQDPYVFLAFPAGNSGVALWFKSADKNANLTAISRPQAISREGGLNGAVVDMKAGTKSLRLTDSVLGSMRFIRDRELGMQIPEEVRTNGVSVVGQSLVLRRKSLNGLADYLIVAEPLGDTRLVDAVDGVRFESPTEVQFRMKGYTGEKPLTPIPPEEVFKKEVLTTIDPMKLQAFSFLLYKEKLMAGSPRYLSKFGRDSIYTLRALMDSLKPEAIESLLSAMLSSSHPTNGRISHEQHEGDFASYERMRHKEKYRGITDTIEDYKMIDDDFAFTIVVTEYMKRYPERVREFLDGFDQRGLSLRQLVQNNFEFVMKSAAPFAANPIYKNLIRIQKGEKTGEWRDSEAGLGDGAYPFDVNAAFVPGALKALADIHAAKDSEFQNKQKADELARAFFVWNTRVVPLFEVRVSAKDLPSYGDAYFKDLGIDASRLPAPPKEDLEFPAISLDESGKPVPIMHSDDSLMMTFGFPSKRYLNNVSQRIQFQFPYGLYTPVGILVANPVFASRELQHKFDETKYHGRVSWTMQEDLLVFGIDRQLKRAGLDEELKVELIKSKRAIEKVIRSKASMGGTEVFSIVYRNGSYEAVPFAGDAKSNSNQLWSHLRIALPSSKSHAGDAQAQ